VHIDLGARTDDAFPAEIWDANGLVEKCETRAAIGIALEKRLVSGIEVQREPPRIPAGVPFSPPVAGGQGVRPRPVRERAASAS
jgi:hypothetical protein